MIRYPITLQDLVDRINLIAPTWITRASARTQEYVAAGCYTAGSEFWGDIKKVYIDLQAEKCAYCETKLQGAILASKVHEVEHYRPKSSVRAWPNASNSHWKNFKASWPLGDKSSEGYYRLAYHPLNYAIACTRCNSTLKSNYFPVRATRNIHGDHPSDMSHESALLLYPISTVDPDDPEEVITFDGPLAIPKYPSGPAFERAATNIAFFQLNHEDLTTRRSLEIVKLCVALQHLGNGPSSGDKAIARIVVESTCGASSQFSSCMRAFRNLYKTDRNRAEAIATNAALLL